MRFLRWWRHWFVQGLKAMFLIWAAALVPWSLIFLIGAPLEEANPDGINRGNVLAVGLFFVTMSLGIAVFGRILYFFQQDNPLLNQEDAAKQTRRRYIGQSKYEAPKQTDKPDQTGSSQCVKAGDIGNSRTRT